MSTLSSWHTTIHTTHYYWCINTKLPFSPSVISRSVFLHHSFIHLLSHWRSQNRRFEVDFDLAEFAFPGIRLETSFVGKNSWCPAYHFFRQLSLLSCTLLHWTIQFLSSFSVLLWKSNPTWTSEASRLRRDKKPRKTCSQGLAQMAYASAWQAIGDPPDQHVALNMHCTNHTAAWTRRNSLMAMCACVLCPNLWLTFLEVSWRD